jgi:imidazolonepropionase-like amidohydrolase
MGVCLSASAMAQEPMAIIVGRYVAPDGSLKSDVAIVLADGKIQSVVPANAYKEHTNVARRPDAVACPGLIDIYSRISAYDNATETAHSIDPGASVVDSVDRNHRDFRSAVEAGITTVMITPSPNNLVSGAAAVVKTAAVPGHDPVLRKDGPLMFALGPTVWEYDRAPTSRVGSLSMLRETLQEAKGGGGHKRLQAFLEGRLDGIVFCQEAMDVSAALRTFSEHGRAVSIVHTSDTHEVAPELARLGSAIIVGPYTFGTSPRTLASASAFSSSGVPVAFAARMPEHSGDALRITAALAVRYGMDPVQARQAMTVTPAIVAGVSKRVGSLHAGGDADLVLFSDDPLRLNARVLEVYVDGVRVHHAGLQNAVSSGGAP